VARGVISDDEASFFSFVSAAGIFNEYGVGTRFQIRAAYLVNSILSAKRRRERIRFEALALMTSPLACGFDRFGIFMTIVFRCCRH
jgi:hypothetical protein